MLYAKEMQPKPVKSGLSARAHKYPWAKSTPVKTREFSVVDVPFPGIGPNTKVTKQGDYLVFEDPLPLIPETLEERSRRIDLQELRLIQAGEAMILEREKEIASAMRRQVFEFEDVDRWKGRYQAAAEQRAAGREQIREEKRQQQVQALIKHRSVQKQLNLQSLAVSPQQAKANEEERARREDERLRRKIIEENKERAADKRAEAEFRFRMDPDREGFRAYEATLPRRIARQKMTKEELIEDEDEEMAEILFEMGTGRI